MARAKVNRPHVPSPAPPSTAAPQVTAETPLDCQALAADWVRVLRGKRSQAAFSRRLGYQSNVVHRWESGAAWPTAARFLQVCAQCGKDVRSAFQAFFLRAPSWLGEHEPSSPEAVAALLRRLQGKMTVVTLARSSGFSRYAIARWLDARAEPKLPEFLRLLESSSRRALDFIATFTDPAQLPSAQPHWQRLEQLREAAYRETWSHAVLRALELEEYQQASDDSWLSRVLGIEPAQVERALEVLQSTGQIARRDGRWVSLPATAVTTGRHPATFGILTRAWTRVALERIEQHAPAHFGYSVFALSRKDLRRLRELQLEYLREMQSIIAASTPNECVGLFCLQLLDLSTGEDNALAGD